MFVAIQTVRKGDTIRETYLDGKRRLQVEKGPGTTVTKVEHSACSDRGTHINSRECFDFGTLVWRTVEIEANTLVEWDIDNNVPVSDPTSPFNPNDDYTYPLGRVTSIEETPDGLVAKGVTYNGDPLAAELLEKIFSQDSQFLTEVHLGELFPNPWDEHVATQQRLVAAGVVDAEETGRQLKNYLRAQGSRRVGR